MFRLKNTLALFTVIVPLSVFAKDWGIGTGQNDGTVQEITGWNNDAQTFGSAAEEWKKKWPPEKVKRDSFQDVSEDSVIYCLSGKKDGAGLLSSGNSTSVNYEGYLGSHPGDASVTPAYTDHEGNLQSLNQAWKKANEAAKCN